MANYKALSEWLKSAEDSAKRQVNTTNKDVLKAIWLQELGDIQALRNELNKNGNEIFTPVPLKK